MKHIEKTIVEFDKIAGLLIYVKDFNGKPETVWQVEQIRQFLRSSHTSFVTDLIQRVEGERKRLPIDPFKTKLTNDEMVFNSALDTIIKMLKEEI